LDNVVALQTKVWAAKIYFFFVVVGEEGLKRNDATPEHNKKAMLTR